MAEKKLKKLSKKRAPKSRSILDSANQIWLAGLGAFAKAQGEGGKIFETLVREGMEIESNTRNVTSAKVNEVRGAVEGTVSQVQAQVQTRASKSWDKLEKVFEDRVARALGALGVPTASDISALTSRVAELQGIVDDLKAKRAATSKPKPAVRKTATKKTAAKKTAAKKPAARKAPVKKAAAKPAAKKTARKTATKKAATKKAASKS